MVFRPNIGGDVCVRCDITGCERCEEAAQCVECTAANEYPIEGTFDQCLVCDVPAPGTCQFCRAANECGQCIDG